MSISRLRKTGRRILVVLLLSVLAFTGASTFELPQAYAASAPAATATAKVTVKGGTYIRKSTSNKSAKVKLVKKNAKVTVMKEIFCSKTSTSSKNRWYYVSYGGKTGYIRADKLGSFSYKTVKGTTTDKLNYRAGAGAKMKKKGSFKKGTDVTVYLEGSPKGSKVIWYKVKVGKKLYYVHSGYVKLTPKTTSATKSSSSSKTSTTASPSTSSSVAAAVPAPTGDPNNPKFTLSGITYPKTLGETLPFSLKGTIKADVTMAKGVFSIVNSKGKAVISAEKAINSTTFSISAVDASIKFGTLSPGTYTYKGDIYVGSKCFNQFKYTFTVKPLEWGDKIARTAIALAYPIGTSTATYSYSGGAPSQAYKDALNAVYPNRSSWGAAPKVGASCDVFVGTVVRYSGYDKEMPRGLGDMSSGQWCHLNKSDKWQEISYSYKESQLKNGDIIIYKRYSGSQHICIYVKINGTGYLAEAAIKNYYGHLSKLTSSNKIFKSSDKEKIKVYRATDNADKPIDTNNDAIDPKPTEPEPDPVPEINEQPETEKASAAAAAKNASAASADAATSESTAEITDEDNAAEEAIIIDSAEIPAADGNPLTETEDTQQDVQVVEDAVLPDDGVPKGE